MSRGACESVKLVLRRAASKGFERHMPEVVVGASAEKDWTRTGSVRFRGESTRHKDSEKAILPFVMLLTAIGSSLQRLS